MYSPFLHSPSGERAGAFLYIVLGVVCRRPSRRVRVSRARSFSLMESLWLVWLSSHINMAGSWDSSTSRSSKRPSPARLNVSIWLFREPRLFSLFSPVANTPCQKSAIFSSSGGASREQPVSPVSRVYGPAIVWRSTWRLEYQVVRYVGRLRRIQELFHQRLVAHRGVFVEFRRRRAENPLAAPGALSDSAARIPCLSLRCGWLSALFVYLYPVAAVFRLRRACLPSPASRTPAPRRAARFAKLRGTESAGGLAGLARPGRKPLRASYSSWLTSSHSSAHFDSVASPRSSWRKPPSGLRTWTRSFAPIRDMYQAVAVNRD